MLLERFEERVVLFGVLRLRDGLLNVDYDTHVGALADPCGDRRKMSRDLRGGDVLLGWCGRGCRSSSRIAVELCNRRKGLERLDGLGQDLRACGNVTPEERLELIVAANLSVRIHVVQILVALAHCLCEYLLPVRSSCGPEEGTRTGSARGLQGFVRHVSERTSSQRQ